MLGPGPNSIREGTAGIADSGNVVGVILSPWTLALDIWKCPDRCFFVYALGYHKESLIALGLGCNLREVRVVEGAHEAIVVFLQSWMCRS